MEIGDRDDARAPKIELVDGSNLTGAVLKVERSLSLPPLTIQLPKVKSPYLT